MNYIVLALVLINGTVAVASAQTPHAAEALPRITVNGDAVVKVVPDRIVLTFGIETWDSDILVAKQKNNRILQQTLRGIAAMGIPDTEVQTDHLSIQPRYESDYNRQNFIGYFVRNTFVVTLAEADRVEALVTSALEAGVNHIHDIDFQTSAFKSYREQARHLALKAAREKATQMAAALGQTIGAPLQITEHYGGAPWRYYSSWSGWGYGRGSGMSQNVIQNLGPGAGAPSETVALGKVSIQATVTVAFQLLD